MIIMKIISWNVDGLKAILNKGFIDDIIKEDPDLICLQNIRESEKIDLGLDNYQAVYSLASDRKGYAGTLVLSKIKYLNTQFGSDEEGRIIVVEYNDFYLINAYTPTSQHDFKRLDYRLAFNQELLDIIKAKQDKPIILAGDLNVAHLDIDVVNPSVDKRKPGFSDIERKGFDNLLALGLVDVYRYFYPDKAGSYTYWSNLRESRERNVGWRLDYFLVSDSLKNKLVSTKILVDVLGSEHAPIIMDIDI